MPFHFFVGATEAAKAAGVDAAELKLEERVLKTAGNALYLLGGDVPEKIVGVPEATVTSARGTLYAVYDFLETEMGVRWLWPGKSGEFIPQTASIALAAIDRRGIEPYARRYWHGINRSMKARDGKVYGWTDKAAMRNFFDEQSRFMVRHRIGKREAMNSGHAFKKFVERYLDTHPEYFQLKPDGTRGPWHPGKAGWNCSMCVSNPDLPKLVVDEWYAKYVRELKGAKIPVLPVVNACENDTPGACLCEKCRSWDGPDPNFKLNAYWNGSDKSPEMSSSRGIYGRLADMNRWGESATKPPTKYSANVSDRYAKFYNAVLAEARKKVPEARVVAYAYQNYLPGPIDTKVDPGVIIDFVPRMYLPYDKEESDFMRKCWETWRRSGVKDLIFRPNFTHAFGGFPVGAGDDLLHGSVGETHRKPNLDARIAHRQRAAHPKAEILERIRIAPAVAEFDLDPVAAAGKIRLDVVIVGEDARAVWRPLGNRRRGHRVSVDRKIVESKRRYAKLGEGNRLAGRKAAREHDIAPGDECLHRSVALLRTARDPLGLGFAAIAGGDKRKRQQRQSNFERCETGYGSHNKPRRNSGRKLFADETH
jgi:hypothetical protein